MSMKQKLLILMTSILYLIIVPVITQAAPPPASSKTNADDIKLQVMKENPQKAREKEKISYANKIINTSSNNIELAQLVDKFNKAKGDAKVGLAKQIIQYDPEHVEANCTLASNAKNKNNICSAFQHSKIVISLGKECTPKSKDFVIKYSNKCSDDINKPHENDHLLGSKPNTSAAEVNDLESQLINSNGSDKTVIAEKILSTNPRHINANCQIALTYFMSDICTAYKHYKRVLEQGHDCVPSGREFVRMNASRCADSSYVGEYQH